MGSDEIGTRQTIAIKKNTKLAAAGANAAIPDLAAAKAMMLMPGVLYRNAGTRHPACDHVGGIGSRAVIGDYDLKIAVRLTGKRAQHRVERIFAVVGRHDHRDEVSGHCN